MAADGGKVVYVFDGNTKNLENSLKNVDNEVTSKSNGIANKIGGAFMKGAAVAGTALTGLVAASVNAYADMEQNLGGVETLFKDSADKVIANSKRAYESAGMSANEYMETVTGFSASLLQGLGGDTQKAAEIADMAVTDMADNANKMGTSMGLIQNAYQGFAKQNYTMLDNLKLGYGGTQSEMARLINDSGVLGDTMTVTAETVNQVSFDKIIEAIHKIQDNMGITGTTSKEAADTITGSMSSAKAAFDNFLSGAGDIDTVVDTFTTAGKNIMNALIEMAPKITEGLVQLVNGLIPQIPTLIQNLLPTIVQGVIQLAQGLITALPQIISVLTQMLPQIIQMVINGLMQIGQALIQQLPVIIPQIITALINALAMINEHFDEFLNMGIQIIWALIQGLLNSIPTILQNLPTIITAIVNFFSISKFLKMGKSVVTGLWNGIKNLVGTLKGNVKGFTDNILNWFKSGFSKIGDIGKNLVKGLWNGIKNVTGWIIDKIKGFGKSVLNGIKKIFGIHSPSTEFAWIGKMNVIGLNEGMEAMKGKVQATFDDLVNLSPQLQANASNYFSPQTTVIVNNQFETDPLGQMVNKIKTSSGGSKNDYNFGLGG